MTFARPISNDICISIFSVKKSNRLTYILDFFFREVMDMNYLLFDNQEDFLKCCNTKINYSTISIPKIFQIVPHELLFCEDISPQNIQVEEFGDLPFFFRTSDFCEIPFDIFAASFWLITRYEEYLPFETDKHGRFSSTESLAHKQNFLHRPLVDLYVKLLIQKISTHQCLFPIRRTLPEFLPTFDIDNTFAYKSKGLMRSGGAFFSDFVKLRFAHLLKRFKVHTGIMRDPYDTYDYIYEILKKYSSKAIFFILCGEYSEFDKNINPNSSKFRQLIKKITQFAKIGIHPSYRSNHSLQKLQSEITLLEKNLEYRVVDSRQHYLKLNFPETYNALISCDIENDYTMGYADVVGFRASTCTPFYFFDLQTNSKTNLKIYPFISMDATFEHYLKCSPSEALIQISTLLDEIAAVNGLFISIWHNHTLSPKNIEWRKLFEQIFEMTKNKDFKLSA